MFGAHYTFIACALAVKVSPDKQARDHLKEREWRSHATWVMAEQEHEAWSLNSSSVTYQMCDLK